MKFFQGRNEIMLDDIARECDVIKVGQVRTSWGNNSPLNGIYKKYGDCVVITDTTDMVRTGERRLLHRPDEIAKVVDRGECVSSWGAKKEFINLKYVPQRIKNADYKSSADYLDAVMGFINGAKMKAKGKATIKKHNSKTEAGLNFIDAQSIIDDVVAKAGWTPLKGFGDYATMNDYYKKHGQTKFEYQKDRLHKMAFEIQASRKGLAKIVVTGLDAEKSKEILSSLFGFMG